MKRDLNDWADGSIPYRRTRRKDRGPRRLLRPNTDPTQRHWEQARRLAVLRDMEPVTRGLFDALLAAGRGGLSEREAAQLLLTRGAAVPDESNLVRHHNSAVRRLGWLAQVGFARKNGWGKWSVTEIGRRAIKAPTTPRARKAVAAPKWSRQERQHVERLVRECLFTQSDDAGLALAQLHEHVAQASLQQLTDVLERLAAEDVVELHAGRWRLT